MLETATGLVSAQRQDVSLPARLQRIRDALETHVDQLDANFDGLMAEDASLQAQIDALAAGAITDHGALTGLGDDDHTQYHNDSRALTWLNGLGNNSKSITIESPTADDAITIFRTNRAITITKLVAVIVGGTSAVFTVRHSTDRSATGNEAVTGGSTCSSTTTGTVVTSFNDATVPIDSFVWVDMGTITGTVTQFHLTVFYTEDA